MKWKSVILLFLPLLLILPLRITQSETPDIEPILTHSYVDHEPIVITTDQNFTDYGFPGAGTEENPYRIENYKITSPVSGICISIEHTFNYFIIQNCYLENASSSIYINDVLWSSALIFNNTCIDAAIRLYSSEMTTVANNTIKGTSHGGYAITASSDGTIITNNTFLLSGYYAINVLADYLQITNNHFSGADKAIYSSMFGCHYSLISNNTFINNEIGIYLIGEFNTITYNLIKTSLSYGITTSSWFSADNVIYHNAFVDNNIMGGGSQACDEGTNNIWYDTSTNTGNYWSDWSGIGNYSINGSVNSEDPYPLGLPPVPTISEYNNNFIFFLPFILVPLVFYLNRKKD